MFNGNDYAAGCDNDDVDGDGDAAKLLPTEQSPSRGKRERV